MVHKSHAVSIRYDVCAILRKMSALDDTVSLQQGSQPEKVLYACPIAGTSRDHGTVRGPGCGIRAALIAVEGAGTPHGRGPTFHCQQRPASRKVGRTDGGGDVCHRLRGRVRGDGHAHPACGSTRPGVTPTEGITHLHGISGTMKQGRGDAVRQPCVVCRSACVSCLLGGQRSLALLGVASKNATPS